jgi:prophage regulatory protein
MHANTPRRLLRRRQVEDRTGLSRATIYRFLDQGRFPKPTKAGDWMNLWAEDEIDAWINERLAAREGK